MAFTGTIRNILTSRGFMIGMGLSAIFYTSVAGWVLLRGNEAISSLDTHLASQTIPIIRPDVIAIIPDEGLHPSDRTDVPVPSETQEQPSEATPEEHHATNTDTETHTATTPAPHNTADEAAPITGLYETDAHGNILPIIRAADGMTPYEAYKAPAPLSSADDKTPVIAIVIDDAGLNASFADQALSQLPGGITFVVSPYADSAEKLQSALRQNGHELWLKLPMENQNFPYDEPGAKAILSRASQDANLDNLRWVMSRFSGYAGIAPYLDLAFSDARPMLGEILKESFSRGLGYFELNPAAPDQAKDAASRINAPYIRNEIQFQDPKWNGQTEDAWDLLGRIAQSKGYAVGVFKPYPETLTFLSEKLAGLEGSGYKLVPLSTIHTKSAPKPPSPSAPAPDSTPEDPAPSSAATTNTAPPDEHSLENPHHDH